MQNPDESPESTQSPSASASDAPARPGRTRYVTVFWLCSMATVLYLDRVGWSKAAPSIQKEFQLTNESMSYLHMGFTVAYALFEIPTGHWGEVWGARVILTRIAVWWSIFTALTGAGFGFWSLLVVRFLFGAGEAGAYPNAARVFTRWFPKDERGRFQGLMLASALIGGALSPTLAAELIELVGWRATFVVFGAVGIFWATGFWIWFRDDPAEHRSVGPAELARIRDGGGVAAAKLRRGIPWKRVFSSRGILVLSTLIMLSSFNSYFYFSWFPTYLEQAHGLQNRESGRLTSLALAGAAAGMLLGGAVSDQITRRGRARITLRRTFCTVSFLCAAGALSLAVRSSSALGLSVMAALSCFFVQVTLPTWWSSAIEQSGRYVGTLFGMMNMVGQCGAVASQYFVGWFADRQKAAGLTGRAQWDPMFDVYVVVLILGAVGWAVYHYRPLELDYDEDSVPA